MAILFLNTSYTNAVAMMVVALTSRPIVQTAHLITLTETEMAFVQGCNTM